MDSSILVTGAAKRIGRDIALTLAAAGYHIHLHYHNSGDEARQTLTDIETAGGSASLVQADLADYDAAQRLIPGLAATNTPPLRHLVNNASQFDDDTLFSLDAASFQSHMDVNLRAPLQLSRGLYDSLGTDDNKGSVVNIIDSSIFAMNPDFLSYSLSKYALSGATEASAMAMAPRVRVNAVAPGLTLLSGDQTEDNFELTRHFNLNESSSTAKDIAATVRHLIETPSFNAAVLPLDSGQKNLHMNRDVARIAEKYLGKE
ncbi:SDR family NAD(P)-dependent oxidoreductase [Emcibacter nanhaiensis]|uniref:SDR family NAD(P)-dependent oxidoreductase n=1 Tax=Emcibacter nanhaiensis TaxID=1505037 RepID=A0A501PGJ0_9PROT|nr:SDR family NAD(P)-dependent oxidoreductase [Emcibacter nanhaiensis]TPD59177.1 SDR family NAD(P)-dependent oxidoreductase [Emcibacter nanhaiensis]